MTVENRNEFSAGWRVLAGSLIGISIGFSSLYFYSLGVFIKPLAAEFGWTRGQASLGALVSAVCAAGMSPIIGRIVDRIGSFPVAIASIMMLSVGLIAHPMLISGLLSFLLVTVLFAVMTAGTGPLPYVRLTVASFVKNRGLALGMVLAGTGFGAILVPLLLVAYVATEGWRAGYLALAVVSAIGLPIVALLLRGHKEVAASRAQPLAFAEIVGTPGFKSIAMMFLLAAIAILGAVVHFVPMLTDAGLDSAKVGRTAALIGVSAIFGRLFIGFLLDRLPYTFVAAGLFALAACGMGMMAFGGVDMAVPGAIITGIAVGGEVDLLAFLTARYFPAHAFGQANGILYAIFLIGAAIGPMLSAFLFDLSGSYSLSLSVATALLVQAALLGWLLPQVERRS